MSNEKLTSHSILGVVGDVRREMSGHHYAEVSDHEEDQSLCQLSSRFALSLV